MSYSITHPLIVINLFCSYPDISDMPVLDLAISLNGKLLEHIDLEALEKSKRSKKPGPKDPIVRIRYISLQ